MAKLTLNDVKKLFPSARAYTSNSWAIFSDEDAIAWNNDPVCFNAKCLSEDIRYLGVNPDYETEVYECRDCKSILVQGTETRVVGGNIGTEQDGEDLV
jgi:hypothetical protein|tara:strand:+ start:1285 stop:1578 length:294 start_codon:yes stop_codon:yes gene_type:complete